jgi:class I fructose-bisphosphate aldolase
MCCAAFKFKENLMKLSRRVKGILDHYDSRPVGVRANLARILREGKLGG